MRLTRIFAVTAVAGLLASLPMAAEAQRGQKGPPSGVGGGNQGGVGGGNQGVFQGQNGGQNNWETPPGWGKGQKRGWQGAQQPPRSEQGKRKGWDDETLPPRTDQEEMMPSRTRHHLGRIFRRSGHRLAVEHATGSKS